VLVGGNALGTLTLGWVADHAGHRLVLLVGAAANVSAGLVALLAGRLGTFAIVFALVGVHQAAINVSALNVLLEFAPSADARPTYVGLGSTLMAPVAFAAPLLGGLMADAFGFPPLFFVAVAAGLAGLIVLATRVHDPRRLLARAPGEAAA
jgi:MFS family permease